MESGFTKEQLENKLKALKEFPDEVLGFLGLQTKYYGIKRITRKLKIINESNI